MANWSKAFEIMGDTAGNIGKYVSEDNRKLRERQLKLQEKADDRAYAEGLVAKNRAYTEGQKKEERTYQEGLVQKRRKEKQDDLENAQDREDELRWEKQDAAAEQNKANNASKEKVARIKADAVANKKTSTTGMKPAQVIAVKKEIGKVLNTYEGGAKEVPPADLAYLNDLREMVGEPPLKQDVEKHTWKPNRYSLVVDYSGTGSNGITLESLKAAMDANRRKGPTLPAMH